MRVTVNDNCNGSGQCADTCPQVFEVDEDGRARVKLDPVPEAAAEACRRAARGCPFDAIEVQE